MLFTAVKNIALVFPHFNAFSVRFKTASALFVGFVAAGGAVFSAGSYLREIRVRRILGFHRRLLEKS